MEGGRKNPQKTPNTNEQTNKQKELKTNQHKNKQGKWNQSIFKPTKKR